MQSFYDRSGDAGSAFTEAWAFAEGTKERSAVRKLGMSQYLLAIAAKFRPLETISFPQAIEQPSFAYQICC